MCSIKSAVRRRKSARSPNSGEMISFHRCSSPDLCQFSSRVAMSIFWSSRPKPTPSTGFLCVALSRSSPPFSQVVQRRPKRADRRGPAMHELTRDK